MIARVLPIELFPALILIGGGLVVPLVSPTVRKLVMLSLPVVAGYHLMSYADGNYGMVQMFDFTLMPMRVDALSRIFALVFCLATAANVLYAWQVEDRMQQAAALVYPGTAIGAVFAGDFITLFVFWELAALASVCLIWAGRSERAMKAGLRYLLIHVGSGLLLLAGLILFARETGSIYFGPMRLGTLPVLLIFLAFGIKSAFPLLHNWVQDAYPESTATGTVVLAVFTTKLAVYALARGFAGTPELIYIGTAMTLFPIFFAVIEDNLRRVLCYSVNNQVGFMVVAIGVGTPLALNGAVGYAVCNVIFESLLFMSIGAVLTRAGTAQASELGGLYKSMPLTAAFCIIGALSIAAFPLFAGFVAKGLIIDSVTDAGLLVVWLALLFASAGVLEHAGIKVPYFGFFGHDSGKRCAEAPLPMLLAMGVLAFLCVAIGVFPAPLYALLPYDMEYAPYTPTHVLTQLQLLLFAVLAFVALVRTGVYPREIKSTNLDSDWLYRRLAPSIVMGVARAFIVVRNAVMRTLVRRCDRALHELYRWHGPQGPLARSWPAGSMALWIALLLGAALVLSYL